MCVPGPPVGPVCAWLGGRVVLHGGAALPAAAQRRALPHATALRRTTAFRRSVSLTYGYITSFVLYLTSSQYYWHAYNLYYNISLTF